MAVCASLYTYKNEVNYLHNTYIYIPSYIHTQGTASPKMLEGRGGFGGGRPACTVRFRAAFLTWKAKIGCWLWELSPVAVKPKPIC